MNLRFQATWSFGAGAALGVLEIAAALSEPGVPHLSWADGAVLLAWLALPYGAAIWVGALAGVMLVSKAMHLGTPRAVFAGTATAICVFGWLHELTQLREAGSTHLLLEALLALLACAAGLVAGALGGSRKAAVHRAAVRAIPRTRKPAMAAGWLILIVWACLGAWQFAEIVSPAEASARSAGRAPSASTGRRPNIVLISIDTLRADHLSSYGYGDSRQPSIDALAAAGVRFAHASSTAAFTVPAHASMMTGLFPTTHGATYRHEDPGAFPIRAMNDSYPTLAEILSAQGYDTAAFVSCSLTGHAFGFARGFDVFDDRIDRLDSARALLFSHTMAFRAMRRAGVFTSRDLDAERRAGEVTPLAQAWIRARSADPRPFFLFVHYYDPHAPYDPPAPYNRRADGTTIAPVYQGRMLLGGSYMLTPAALKDTLTLYDGEIRYVDDQLGELLRTLEESGTLDDTLVILTGDHGESFGEHGHWAHTRVLYEDVTSIPFIMRLPGERDAGTVVNDVIAQPTDILPTVLSVAGLETPPGIEGRDLTAWLASRRMPAADAGRRGGVLARADIAFAEQPRSDDSVRRYGKRWDRDLVTARTLRWKYIHASTGIEELYDLVDDAGETVNLAGSDPAALSLMRRLEADWHRALAAPAEPDGTQTIDEGTRDKLRSLGYVQ